MWVQPKSNGEFEVPYGARVVRTDPGKVLNKPSFYIMNSI